MSYYFEQKRGDIFVLITAKIQANKKSEPKSAFALLNDKC